MLLDFFFDNPVFGENSSSILKLCVMGKIIGYSTPGIPSNVYYILKKGSTHTRVVRKLNQLLSITSVLTMNEKSTIQTLNSRFIHFEAAMQNYAAEINSKVEVILSRNVKDYKESELTVMTPDAHLKSRITSSQQH